MNETIIVTDDVINLVVNDVKNVVNLIVNDESNSEVVTVHVDGPIGPRGNPMPLEFFFGGNVGPSEILFRYIVMRDNLTLSGSTSKASAESPPVANAVFNLYNNNVPVGTIRFTASNTVGLINITDTALVRNDVLKLVAPSVQDAGLADITIAFDLSN